MRTVGIQAAVQEELIDLASKIQAIELGTDENEVEIPEAEPRESRVRALLRSLDERFPILSNWVGGRLDIEVPALFVSLGAHALILLVLGMIGLAVQQEVRREFQSLIETHTELGELDAKIDFQDLDMADKPLTNETVGGTFAPNLAPTTVSAPPGISADPATASANGGAPLELTALEISQANRIAVPTASMLGQTVSVKGNGAEYADGVDGAVDRVAQEILGKLEKGRTLVVWAFDASASLAVEREKLSKQVETIYGHIAELDRDQLSNEGLLTSVVAFGKEREAMTASPTNSREEIVSAIRSVSLDTTGIESTFGTVAEIARRWGRFKDAKGHPYQLMIIVVTDEVGDDESRLEEAIAMANRNKAPVYVLGSQALFGRAMGAMDYFDPKSKQRFRNLPVRQGPESVALEQIKLPFWYDGYQYDMLNSGFGPYALCRLARATGGIFFLTRLGPETRMGFDPVRMLEYKPDLVSREQYEGALTKHPVRQAVIEAALITQQRMGPQPSLTFPPADTPEFKTVMADNQTKAALTANAVDEALGPITQAAKQRDRETSRRWQAHYDLIRGRLLAMKIRCYEYNWACATMKKDMPKFKNERSNAWKLVPNDEIQYSDKAAEAAKQAKELLKRVVDEHPGTPWAVLAQREMKDAFGFKWVETYVRPPQPRGMDAAAKKKRNEPMKKMTRPVEPPKL